MRILREEILKNICIEEYKRLFKIKLEVKDFILKRAEYKKFTDRTYHIGENQYRLKDGEERTYFLNCLKDDIKFSVNQLQFKGANESHITIKGVY